MGRGVKEKDFNRNMKSTSSGIGMSTDSDDIMSDDTPVVPKSFPPLSTPVTMADNAFGKSSYAIITGKPSGKKVNVRTLFTPGGNGIDVEYLGKIWACSLNVQLVNRIILLSISSIKGLDAMLENGPWFIRNNPLILKKWHPDETLLKEDVSTILVWVKLHGIPVTAFNKDGVSAIVLNWVVLLCLTLIRLICACNLGVGDVR
nr:hypothetical protein [Tanacetum cinerariifolium]GFA09553.1 hypothetical protein [Tanacetum cinerariifolium]GFA09593.1 hypothetical protein [Tanacetum cinerariifolium]